MHQLPGQAFYTQQSKIRSENRQKLAMMMPGMVTRPHDDDAAFNDDGGGGATGAVVDDDKNKDIAVHDNGNGNGNSVTTTSTEQQWQRCA
jgi:hypothetical protein